MCPPAPAHTRICHRVAPTPEDSTARAGRIRVSFKVCLGVGGWQSLEARLEWLSGLPPRGLPEKGRSPREAVTLGRRSRTPEWEPAGLSLRTPTPSPSQGTKAGGGRGRKGREGWDWGLQNRLPSCLANRSPGAREDQGGGRSPCPRPVCSSRRWGFGAQRCGRPLPSTSPQRGSLRSMASSSGSAPLCLPSLPPFPPASSLSLTGFFLCIFPLSLHPSLLPAFPRHISLSLPFFRQLPAVLWPQVPLCALSSLPRTRRAWRWVKPGAGGTSSLWGYPVPRPGRQTRPARDSAGPGLTRPRYTERRVAQKGRDEPKVPEQIRGQEDGPHRTAHPPRARTHYQD